MCPGTTTGTTLPQIAANVEAEARLTAADPDGVSYPRAPLLIFWSGNDVENARLDLQDTESTVYQAIRGALDRISAVREHFEGVYFACPSDQESLAVYQMSSGGKYELMGVSLLRAITLVEQCFPVISTRVMVTALLEQEMMHKDGWHMLQSEAVYPAIGSYLQRVLRLLPFMTYRYPWKEVVERDPRATRLARCFAVQTPRDTPRLALLAGASEGAVRRMPVDLVAASQPPLTGRGIRPLGTAALEVAGGPGGPAGEDELHVPPGAAGSDDPMSGGPGGAAALGSTDAPHPGDLVRDGGPRWPHGGCGGPHVRTPR